MLLELLTFPIFCQNFKFNYVFILIIHQPTPHVEVPKTLFGNTTHKTIN